MKPYIYIFISFILLCCSKSSIKTNDEVWVAFSIKNDKGEKVDDNYLPYDKILPLRIVLGNNYLLPQIEKALIGRRKGDKICFSIKSDYAYGERGVFYLDNNDTIYIIKPNEDLMVEITVLEHLASKKQVFQKY
jgi:FKBP-type peptidyl-prolyl cis-trans isomerase